MSPHRIFGGKNPKEAFLRVNPNIGLLRIFGCPIYIHMHVENRMKMEYS
jgi:hypothetical protein